MKKKNLLFILLMIVSWTFYYVLCKICITMSGSPFIAGLFLRTITFAFLSMYWKSISGKLKITKRPMLFLILIGSVVFLFDVLINIGFQYVSVSIGTVLLKTEILFVLLFSIVFFKVKVKKWNFLFILAMLLGVILCMDIHSFDMQFNGYFFLFIISAILNAGCAFTIKIIQEKYGINSFDIAYINNIVSLILYAFCTFFYEKKQIMHLFDEMNRTWLLIVIFLLCSICQSCLMITYYRNLAVLPVWCVKTSLLFVPALSIIIEVVFQHTTISLFSFFGFFLVSFGGLGIILNSKNIQKLED